MTWCLATGSAVFSTHASYSGPRPAHQSNLILLSYIIWLIQLHGLCGLGPMGAVLAPDLFEFTKGYGFVPRPPPRALPPPRPKPPRPPSPRPPRPPRPKPRPPPRPPLPAAVFVPGHAVLACRTVRDWLFCGNAPSNSELTRGGADCPLDRVSQVRGGVRNPLAEPPCDRSDFYALA